jgi:Ras-related protein Rab-18
LTSAYYRGAHGIILVYSITDRESFTNLGHWLKEVDIYSTNEAAIKLLIGNKADCTDSERSVSKDEGRAFAKERGMLFIEASAKTQEGVAQAFDELIQKILDEPRLLEGEEQKGGAKGQVKVDKVDEDEERRPQPAGCC